MNLREVVFKKCAECGRELPEKDIMPSGLCTKCSFDLITAFLQFPRRVAQRIHDIQGGEHNTPCFSTGKKGTCGQVNCEWQEICDSGVIENVL